jgi:hypothetical protein
MKITNNFHVLLDQVDDRDLHDLYSSTNNLKKRGSFECFKSHVNGHYYVKCTYLYDTLLLKDDLEKKDFLLVIKKKMVSGTSVNESPHGIHDQQENLFYTFPSLSFYV